MTEQQKQAVRELRNLIASAADAQPGTNLARAFMVLESILSQTQSALEQCERRCEELRSQLGNTNRSDADYKKSFENEYANHQNTTKALEQAQRERDEARDAILNMRSLANSDCPNCDELQARCAKLEACCAARKEALEYCGCHEHDDLDGHLRPDDPNYEACCFCETVDKVLKDDCGTGWHSPDEWAAMDAKFTAVLGLIQKLQPPGSPPPGDEYVTVNWIVRETQAKLLASEAAGAEMREFVRGPIPVFPLNEWLEARDRLFARPLGTAFLAERERHIRALQTLESRTQGHKPNTSLDIVNAICREALKDAQP